jgi:putative tricarboxylic transport membrane protein
VLPLIIGVILGPELERQLTQALAISSGDVSTLWGEPVAVVIYAVMAVLLVATLVNGLRRRTAKPPEIPADEKELLLR